MIMSCTKYTKEGRYVAATDTPGYLLNADMEQDMHMLLNKRIVRLIPKFYRNFSWKNKQGNP